MENISICYIDEEEDGRTTFSLYFEQFPDFATTCILPGNKSVNDIVDEVVDLNPDIVVIDFYLKYTDPTVPANGDVVLQRITDRKPLLPGIIFTSYEAAAKKSFLSPDKKRNIFTKMQISDPNNFAFKETVLEHVTYYRQLIEQYKTEFAELTLVASPTEDDLGRIKELDYILEGYSDSQNAFAPHDKSDEKLTNLMNLITSTKELIDDIKDKKSNDKL